MYACMYKRHLKHVQYLRTQRELGPAVHEGSRMVSHCGTRRDAHCTPSWPRAATFLQSTSACRHLQMCVQVPTVSPRVQIVW
jgi:hypothetical protein